MLYGRYKNVPVTGVMPDLSNVYTYQPAITYGLKPGDDITTALPTVSENIGFKEGIYYVTADITVTANIYFAPGAKLAISDGVTVIFRGNVAGQPHLIFMNGNVKFEANTIVYPEWFGAVTFGEGETFVDSSTAFQLAVNSLEYTGGCVVLQPGRYINVGDNEEYAPGAGCYYIEHDIEIIYSNISFGCFSGSKAMIFTTGATVIVGGAYWVESVTVHDIMLYSFDPTGPAVSVSNASRSELRDVRIFKYSLGVYTTGTVNQKFINVEVSPFLDVENTMCFAVDDTFSVGNISPNASLVFDHCLANMYGCASGAVGWNIYGSDIRDITLHSCECASGEVGFYIHGPETETGNELAMDIHIENCIADQFQDDGIKIWKCRNAIITVEGGYFSGSPSAHNCIFVAHTDNVTVTAAQLQGDTGTESDYCGVNITYSKGTVVTGCQFLNCREGVRVTAGFATVRNNDFAGKENRLSSANLDLLNAVVCMNEDGNGGAAIISGNVFHDDNILGYRYAINTATSVLPCVVTGNYIDDDIPAYYKSNDIVNNNIGS